MIVIESDAERNRRISGSGDRVFSEGVEDVYLLLFSSLCRSVFHCSANAVVSCLKVPFRSAAASGNRQLRHDTYESGQIRDNGPPMNKNYKLPDGFPVPLLREEVLEGSGQGKATAKSYG